MHEGKCTDDDYDLLNSWLLGNIKPDWSDWDWAGTPVTVSDNEAKEALNTRAAEAFAEQTGRVLHWYHVTDSRGGQPLTDEGLINRLERLHLGLMNQ